jgi:hypothetical protein
VRRALPSPERWQFNPWFEFVDANGRGFAQPDFVLRTKSEILLLECKLTDTLEAREQLQLLYTPLLEHVYRSPVRGVVVAKSLAPFSPDPVFTLREALAAAREGQLPVLHWLGHSSLR